MPTSCELRAQRSMSREPRHSRSSSPFPWRVRTHSPHRWPETLERGGAGEAAESRDKADTADTVAFGMSGNGPDGQFRFVAQCTASK